MKKISRRELLASVASSIAAGITTSGPRGAEWDVSQNGKPSSKSTEPVAPSATRKLSAGDDALLDEIERAAALFFWEQADPATGLVKDRSLADGNDTRDVASIASTGFGLTALCVAAHRGYLDSSKARERVRTTLRFLAGKMHENHGFYFHFVNMRSGDRVWNCELSTIDTSLLFCGVLTARAFFDDDEIHVLATKIFDRADWNWFLDAGKMISMGWKPEDGFLRSAWDSYNELMMIYLLGLGSKSHPLPPESWDAWKRPEFDYFGFKYIGSNAPIFVHQYSHAWFDFRLKRDRYADYFANSILATRAHKQFCLSLAHRFPDYTEDLWGISASDSEGGYVAWGGPPAMGPIDGSVVPCAAAGSLPFMPDDSLRVLQNLRHDFEKRAWKRYGFVDAFNPLKKWTDPDVIGIDQGITMLMAENLRSGFVWETFMKNEVARRGMERAGFKPADPSPRAK
jgi:hypothetical protein